MYFLAKNSGQAKKSLNETKRSLSMILNFKKYFSLKINIFLLYVLYTKQCSSLKFKQVNHTNLEYKKPGV